MTQRAQTPEIREFRRLPTQPSRPFRNSGRRRAHRSEFDRRDAVEHISPTRRQTEPVRFSRSFKSRLPMSSRTPFLFAAGCIAATLVAISTVGSFAADSTSGGAAITVHKQTRKVDEAGIYEPSVAVETWQPRETCVIVCDMWDAHHCLNAVRRAEQLAPRMNAFLKAARERGVFIIHAPSSCMAAYADHPGRKLAQSAPTAGNLPKEIDQWCRHIPAEDKVEYPIDQVGGGEDDDPAEHAEWHAKLTAMGRNPKMPWTKQMDALTIADGDAISDSGIEIWNLLEARGIKNVILVGVHTNMCVLGRPFGLRQMTRNGKNAVLVRDLTDTMYDPNKRPFVSHFEGTRLIVAYIESTVCPTITSVDLLGGRPFRFAGDESTTE
jgi:nicotinamidase-related amidase